MKKIEKPVYGFGKDPIKVLGKIKVPVKYKSRKAELEVLVVDRYDVVNILGLDSFDKIGLGVVDEVCAVEQQKVSTLVCELRNQFPEVFKPGLGKCNNFEAGLILKESSKPRFLKLVQCHGH